MTISTKKKIALFYRYLTRIGIWRGLLLYIRLHVLKHEHQIRVSFLKHPIHLRKNTTDLATFDQVFISSIYKLPLKEKPNVIVDCGANIGAATLYFANRFPGAKIIAIELERSNFELLKVNCSLYPNITVLQRAVTSFEGRVNVVDSGSGKYAYQVKRDGETVNGNVVESIETITLGGIMKQFNLDRIDLLKIDIEGSEKDIFSYGYEAWLPRTNAIAVEVHDRFVPGATLSIMKSIVQYDFEIHGLHEGYFFQR